MAKFTGLVLIALLLCSALTYAARPEPSLRRTSPAESQHRDIDGVAGEFVDDNETCAGVNEEECLMRRTLVAHTDYIYTQNQNP
ncbi:hypothetical protein Nepgr_016699 [Nepenthes gracilis]|uniref:Phytosulfokine n=1 Tax=Nepenthes gracilis TaxID=150966 RepID=A0AAD3SP21_NEPGR|nr:hypothetical protein Nepgr_016699 [Nepenthes gracilis]